LTDIRDQSAAADPFGSAAWLGLNQDFNFNFDFAWAGDKCGPLPKSPDQQIPSDPPIPSSDPCDSIRQADRVTTLANENA